LSTVFEIVFCTRVHFSRIAGFNLTATRVCQVVRPGQTRHTKVARDDRRLFFLVVLLWIEKNSVVL
jgi:hypothetical protein